MLFQRRFHRGLLSGEITLSFRRWSAPRVKVGGRYGCPRRSFEVGYELTAGGRAVLAELGANRGLADDQE